MSLVSLPILVPVTATTDSTSPVKSLETVRPAETKVCWVYLWRDLDLEHSTWTNCWDRHLFRCINITGSKRQPCKNSPPKLKNKFNMFLNNYGWITWKNFLHFILSCWHWSCSCFVYNVITHSHLLALSVCSRVPQVAENVKADISFWHLEVTEQLAQNLIYLRWEAGKEGPQVDFL